MFKVLAAALSLMLVAGCGAARPEPNRGLDDPYGKKIRDWQERIRREGWTEGTVRGLMADCRGLVRYQLELKDHWSTPREFLANGLEGDCEDIAGFLMGTLKRLGYPHRVRILIARDLFNHHALLKVELPNGRWLIFETTPGGRLEVEPARLQPIVEFDEREIYF